LNETRLRAEVEKVRNVTDKGWELLKDLGFVEEAEEEIGEARDDPVAYLVAQLDRFYDAAPSRDGLSRPRGRTSREEKVPPQLTDYEIERSEVFSEYLAKLAGSDSSEVKAFRVEYLLGDELLSPLQARALLTSPVAARWPRLEFDLQGIPIVGHSYHVEEDKHDKRGPYSLVRVSVPTSRNPWFEDRRWPKTGAWEIPEKPADARSNQKPKREIEMKTGSWKILSFPGEDGYTHRTLVNPHSVLGDLHDKVARLIKRYPWEEPDVVWYVLTGETPWVAPLTWQFRGTGSPLDLWSYGYITLKVEPWVSASVVERVYSDLQHQLLGKDNKRVGKKNRELLRFVISRMKSDGSLPKARELVKEWDRTNPQWRYGHEDTEQVRRFRRDYNLARRLLAAPSYELREE
jgi:hypothetical protein